MVMSHKPLPCKETKPSLPCLLASGKFFPERIMNPNFSPSSPMTKMRKSTATERCASAPLTCRKSCISTAAGRLKSRSFTTVRTRDFNPNAKIRSVTEWAKKQFKVDEGRKWVQPLDSVEGEILDADATIGKLVKFPACKLALYPTERCLIQG